MAELAEIEKRVDRAIAGAVTVSTEVGGIKFISVLEMMEFAKLMAVSGVAVPAHCRGQPGVCLAIVTQAHELRMSPYAVARMSYMANDNMAFQSQLIHAIVESRAPLKGRLRHEILGQGDDRRCRVWGTFKGEESPHSYISETLAKLRDARGKNERGQVKGSQMWEQQPEVQLFYSASRTWARINCPDVILGIYSIDELPSDADEMKTVAPASTLPPESKAAALSRQLREANAKHAEKGRGFDIDHVVREASKKSSSVIEGEINSDPAKEEVKNVDPDEFNVEGRGSGAGDGERRADDAVASDGADRRTDEGGTADARSEAATVKGKGEVSPPGDERPTPKGKGKR